MNSFFLLFIGIPALEVFLMIKIGGKIGALNTISLILLTAIVGIYFAKLEGIKTMRSGFMNLYQDKIPIYEIISGATLAIAAILLILPGFATDSFGLLLIFPYTRKLFIKYLSRNYKTKKNTEEKNFIDGEFKDIDDEK